MGTRRDEPDNWGSWEDTVTAQRRTRVRSTPAQRLEWLEEMLELASWSGALARRRALEAAREGT